MITAYKAKPTQYTVGQSGRNPATIFDSFHRLNLIAVNIPKAFVFSILLFSAEMVRASYPPQNRKLTLLGLGNGETVRLSIGINHKTVTLDGALTGKFIAGGEPPHRYTTLLSIRRDNLFYLVAKFRSGSAISDPTAPCGGDRPITLMLIKTDDKLTLKRIQTEIIASCAYNGTGRYVQGPMQITKNSVGVRFEEGNKKYTLLFEADDAEKGLQVLDYSPTALK